MTYENIPGWFDFGWLYDEWARDCRPNAIFVELGVYLGKSITYMCERLDHYGKPDVSVYAVDNWAVDQPRPSTGGARWEGWGGDSWPDARGVPLPVDPRLYVAKTGGPFNTFVDFMREEAKGPLERIAIMRMNSAKAAGAFTLGEVDFVYIDADHSYEAVARDLQAWVPRIRRGGLIAGHDYSTTHYPGVVQAVEERFGGAVEFPGPGPTWVVRL